MATSLTVHSSLNRFILNTQEAINFKNACMINWRIKNFTAINFSSGIITCHEEKKR